MMGTALTAQGSEDKFPSTLISALQNGKQIHAFYKYGPDIDVVFYFKRDGEKIKCMAVTTYHEKEDPKKRNMSVFVLTDQDVRRLDIYFKRLPQSPILKSYNKGVVNEWIQVMAEGYPDYGIRLDREYDVMQNDALLLSELWARAMHKTHEIPAEPFPDNMRK